MAVRGLVLFLVALVASWTVSVAPVWASVAAPGFDGGPKITNAGLLWAGASSGRDGVYLSTPTSTTLVSSSAELPAVAAEDGWVVAKNPRGPLIGRTGHPLRPIGVLRHCRPLGLDPEVGGVETLAHGSLYTVVRASCLQRRPGSGQLLVRIPLGSEKLRVIGMAPTPPAGSTVASLAVAGSRLAVSYFQDSRRRVAVLDASDAHLQYRLTAPTEAGPAMDIQVDDKGNVLVTAEEGIALEPFTPGWWAGPRSRAWHALAREEAPPASLSEGRIVYASGDTPFYEPERKGAIYVLDLATGTTRTVVTFTGSVRVGGLGFTDGVIAWALQRYAYGLLGSSGGVPYQCLAQAGPAELIETPVSAANLPVAVTATPGARPAGKTCIYL